MKALKLMLSGLMLMLMLIGLICAVAAAGIVYVFFMMAGIALFIWGLMTK